MAFLYPGYASYKTLSQRPASEEELERWLMYWSVLGCLVGVEYLAEWIVSWIPFYYTLKTIFLLYLVLPHTQGASYVYTAHLKPFFAKHEEGIDKAIAEGRRKVAGVVQGWVRRGWEGVQAGLVGAVTAGGGTGAEAAAAAAQPPTLGDPVSGPAQLVGSLWRTYGPGIVASGTAMLQSVVVAQPIAEEKRRRESEDELVRERRTSFEEVQVPSDVEGYEVDPKPTTRTTTTTATSWFS